MVESVNALKICLQDVDEFFQTERDHNIVLTGHTRMAGEVSHLFISFFDLLSTFSHLLTLFLLT